MQLICTWTRSGRTALIVHLGVGRAHHWRWNTQTPRNDKMQSALRFIAREARISARDFSECARNHTKDHTRSCDANSPANLTPSLRIPATSTDTHASQHEAFVCHAVCTSTILTRRQRGLTVTVTPNKRWRQKPTELNRSIYPLRESFATSAIQHATDPHSR
jgi:hypothetical protein